MCRQRGRGLIKGLSTIVKTEEMGLGQRPEEDERLSQEEKHRGQRAELEQGPAVERMPASQKTTSSSVGLVNMLGY